MCLSCYVLCVSCPCRPIIELFCSYRQMIVIVVLLFCLICKWSLFAKVVECFRTKGWSIAYQFLIFVFALAIPVGLILLVYKQETVKETVESMMGLCATFLVGAGLLDRWELHKLEEKYNQLTTKYDELEDLKNVTYSLQQRISEQKIELQEEINKALSDAEMDAEMLILQNSSFLNYDKGNIVESVNRYIDLLEKAVNRKHELWIVRALSTLDFLRCRLGASERNADLRSIVKRLDKIRVDGLGKMEATQIKYLSHMFDEMAKGNNAKNDVNENTNK